MRTGFATGVLLVVSLTAGPAVAGPAHEHGSGGPVKDVVSLPGPTRPMDDIAERLHRASPGQVVAVPPGGYHGNLVVDRPVILRGVGWPTLHGHGSGTTVTVTAPGTVITGFVVSGSGDGPEGNPAGIRVEADDVRVERVVVRDSYMGIAAVDVAGLEVLGNHIEGRGGAPLAAVDHATSEKHDATADQTPTTTRGDAIALWGVERAVVRDNVISGARDGVYLSFGSDVLLDRNRIEEGRYAVHAMYVDDVVLAANRMRANLAGAVMMYGGPVLLLRNRIDESRSASTGFGILLKDVEGVEAVENVIVASRVGLQIDGPAGGSQDGIRFHHNTVTMNDVGVSLLPSARATFAGNSFIENGIHVEAMGDGVGRSSRWFDRGFGNYWSSYRGFDRIGDGIGDVPHVEGGTVNELVNRVPALAAIASGPALRLLDSVAHRWVAANPVVVDRLPLMEPVSPGIGGQARSAGAAVPLVPLGLLSLFGALGVMLMLRPRKVVAGAFV